MHRKDENIIKRINEFKEIIAPFFKMKAQIRALLPVKYIIKDGILYPETQWTIGAMECDKRLDELIEMYRGVLKETEGR